MRRNGEGNKSEDVSGEADEEEVDEGNERYREQERVKVGRIDEDEEEEEEDEERS